MGELRVIIAEHVRMEHIQERSFPSEEVMDNWEQQCGPWGVPGGEAVSQESRKDLVMDQIEGTKYKLKVLKSSS